MINQYQDDDAPTKFTAISINTLASKLVVKYKSDTPIKKKRGGLNEITDLRDKTAKLIGKPMMQVARLTKGWNIEELYKTLQAAEQFTKNPAACWWVIYKQKKDLYGKTNNQKLQRVGEKRRSKDCQEGQATLF